MPFFNEMDTLLHMGHEKFLLRHDPTDMPPGTGGHI